MATVDHPIGSTPLPPVPETGAQDITRQRTTSASRRLSINKQTDPYTLPGPPLSPSSGMKNYNHAFANWHTVRMNNLVNANADYQANPMPSPLSSTSSDSLTFSAIPSPGEATNTSPTAATASYFPSATRQRSKSMMSIPSPTPNCPNCGLRRQSNTPEHSLSPPPLASASGSGIDPPTLTQTPPSPRPHLPIHLHNPDVCPDTHYPPRSLMVLNNHSVPSAALGTSHGHVRHHRRRSSSLCYAESFVADAVILDTGAVPVEVKNCWESKAESIARKVCSREIGGVI